MTHWSDVLDPGGPDGAYLPWKKVEPRVGISRTTAWRLQKSGDFPKPYVVSYPSGEGRLLVTRFVGDAAQLTTVLETVSAAQHVVFDVDGGSGAASPLE